MDEEHYHPHRFQLDTIFIGLLGILCGGIIVVIFHCLSSGLCNRVRSPGPPSRPQIARRSREVFVPNSSAGSSSVITVYKGSYVEDKETTCAVCLSEFSEGEEVRVLPECAHMFHVQCIDMWLYSHRNCPLCRADALPPPPHVVVSLPDSGGVPPPELHRLPVFGG